MLPAHSRCYTRGCRTKRSKELAGLEGAQWLMDRGKEVSSRARRDGRLVKRALPGSNEVKAALRGTGVPATAPQKRLGSSGKCGRG